MKLLSLLGVSVALVLCQPAIVQADQLLYLASTKDKSIVAYSVDNRSGKLQRKFQVELPGNAGPLTFSPDKKFVYAAVTGLKGRTAGVTTFQRNADGTLHLLATAKIKTRTPYIRADRSGKYLLAAHYATGEVTVYRIVDGLCTDEMVEYLKTEKTAHCVEFDPSGKFVFVPHTSPNKVYQYRLDAKTGKLIPNDHPFVKGPDENHNYHQPRHYAHHPTLNMAYTSNEKGGGISAWKFDPKKGTLKLMQTLPTLPQDFTGRSAAADIHISPNGRFVYVSNRDVTQERTAGKDTLAGFSLDPKTGKMTSIGHFATTRVPRSFCIDLTGQFLYAVGQRSHKLFAYRINQKTGKLSHFATLETGGVPIWVMCGEVGR